MENTVLISDCSPFFVIPYLRILIRVVGVEAIARKLTNHKSVLAPLEKIHRVPFGKMALEAGKALKHYRVLAVRTFADVVMLGRYLNLMLTMGAISLLKLFLWRIAVKDEFLGDTEFAYPFAEVGRELRRLLEILVPRVCHFFVLFLQALVHNVILKTSDQINRCSHITSKILSHGFVGFTKSLYVTVVKVGGPGQTPEGAGQPTLLFGIIGQVVLFFLVQIDLVNRELTSDADILGSKASNLKNTVLYAAPQIDRYLVRSFLIGA